MTNLNKITRYALYASMELAKGAEDDEPITAARVAEIYSIPATVVAKAFQQLVRGGIAVGIRGSGGGYRLARRPTELTILDVLEVFEPRREPGQCLLDADADEESCRVHASCRLRRLFDEVDELARSTFASITLETLVGSPRPGMGLPVVETTH